MAAAAAVTGPPAPTCGRWHDAALHHAHRRRRAACRIANIDTDKIIPARFLKTIKRTGLGVHLFDTLRYDADGSERPEFVLNQPSRTATPRS